MWKKKVHAYEEMSSVRLLPNFNFNQVVAQYQVMINNHDTEPRQGIQNDETATYDTVQKWIQTIEDTSLFVQAMFDEMKLPQFDEFARDMKQLFSRMSQILGHILHPDAERTNVGMLIFFADKTNTAQFMQCKTDIHTAIQMYENLVQPIVATKRASDMQKTFQDAHDHLTLLMNFCDTLPDDILKHIRIIMKDDGISHILIPESWRNIFKTVRNNIVNRTFATVYDNVLTWEDGTKPGCKCTDVDADTGDFVCECRYGLGGTVSPDVRIDGTLLSIRNFPSIQAVLKRTQRQSRPEHSSCA